MPTPVEVRPGKWADITVLFDNGRYSVVSGIYDGEGRALGERWNGQTDAGFPNQGGNPLWHVVPEFFHGPILHGLLDELARYPGPQSQEYTAAILRELGLTHQQKRRLATGT